MKSTKILALIVGTVLLCGNSFAQREGKRMSQEERKEKKEKIHTLKVSYITEKLALTPKEAEQFWPIYNKHDNDKMDARKSRGMNHKKGESKELNETEASAKLNTSIERKEAELKLYKGYISELKTVIPATKIVKLQEAERDFKKELLKKIKKGGSNELNIPPPPPKPKH